MYNSGVEEGTQTKVIENLLNEIITKYSPNLWKEMGIQMYETLRTPHTHDQKRTSSLHIIV
jgi:hypothetical protein